MKRARQVKKISGARIMKKSASPGAMEPRVNLAVTDASGAGGAALVLSSVIVRAWAMRRRAA